MSHTVKLNLDTNLVSQDVSIEVNGKDGKLGKLLISKGNIEWLPSKNSVHKHRLSWTKFAALMQETGKSVRSKAKKVSVPKTVAKMTDASAPTPKRK